MFRRFVFTVIQVFACMGLPLMGQAAQQVAHLTSVNVEEKASQTVITLDFDGTFDKPQLFALDNPRRWVLDVAGVSYNGRAAITGGGVVNSLRLGQPKPGTTRLVIDLKDAAIVAGTRTFDALENSHKTQLIIELKPVDATLFAQTLKRGKTILPGTKGSLKIDSEADEKASDVGANFGQTPPPVAVPDKTPQSVEATKPAAVKIPPKPVVMPVPVAVASTPVTQPLPPEQITVAVEKPPLSVKIHGRLPIVVIDAGHGGQDPGAPSVLAGRKEKEVTLAIARAVKVAIDESGKAKAMLTRSTDIFIPLTGRVEIARKLGADLFISIHADSIVDPTIRGATVYTLSTRASDKEAEKLAAKENKADIISGINLGGESPDVTNILIDLAQHETMNYSSEFAQTTVHEVSKSVYFRSNFHRFAGFIVLKAPDVPSILLETGYMSNAADSKFLFSEDGQKAIGLGVANAVIRFFERRVAAN